MNKNCIILEFREPMWGGEHKENVWPILEDYDSPAERFTEDEAAVQVDRLIKENPKSRYQVVILAI